MPIVRFSWERWKTIVSILSLLLQLSMHAFLCKMDGFWVCIIFYINDILLPILFCFLFFFFFTKHPFFKIHSCCCMFMYFVIPEVLVYGFHSLQIIYPLLYNEPPNFFPLPTTNNTSESTFICSPLWPQ